MEHTQRGLGTVLTIIIILAALIVAGILYNYFSNQTRKAERQQQEALIKKPKVVTVALHELNNSTVTGTARLVEAAGKTEVALSLTNASSQSSHPAHIHTGTCDAPGEVVYPLSNAEKGISETVVDASLDSILSGLPLLINVHESAKNIQNYIACGNIPAQ